MLWPRSSRLSTTPVAMVTGLVAMEIYGILRHVTLDGGHVTRDSRHRPW